MIDSIGFDLDGTLWDFAGRYADFFAEAVENMPGVHRPTVEEVYAVTGLAAIEYVENLFPELKDAEEQVKLEPSRKVVKKNAGKPNENISIGQDEIDANTRLVLPGLTEKEYRAFRGFHENNITGAARCWA